MGPRIVVALMLFCVLSVGVTQSKSLPQKKEISQGKERCDHCEELIKADASVSDFLRSSKQSLEPDLPSKNISESTKAEDTKRVEGLPLEDCKFNCTKSFETADEKVRKIPYFASREEEEEFKKIRVPRAAVKNPPAANYNPKMRSEGKPGGFNGRSIDNLPLKKDFRALTNLNNQTSSDDKPARVTVTPSTIKVTPASAEELSLTKKVTPAIAEELSLTKKVTPAIAEELSLTKKVTPAIAETNKITGIDPNTATFSIISTTAEVNTTPNTETTEPPEPLTTNKEGQLQKIRPVENVSEQIDVMEEITDFLKCLIEYVDLRGTKPLREECGYFMDKRLFEDLMEYIDLSTQLDFYGLEDFFDNLQSILLQSGFDSGSDGTQKAQ